MTIDKVYNNFETSTNWNAYFYIIQKIFSALFTFILFKKLSAHDFATWANINSIVFLTLLWMDFGFRKSVPKFIPEFSKNKQSHLSFTKFIIKWQLFTLFIVLFFLTFNIKAILSHLGINMSQEVRYLTITFFFLEAPIAFLRLMYHAHFWNKYFNILYSIVIFFETLMSLILITNISNFSIINILMIKIVAASLTIIVSVFGLIKLYNSKQYAFDDQIDHNHIHKTFVKHSSIMWCNNALKSLSERNFLVPLITFVLGPELANIFKIANDWALIFQRSILKTIGTNDTSLFSYVNIIHKDYVQEALNKIIKKILLLCIPLIFVFFILLLNKSYFLGENQVLFRSFLILSIFYFMESILSPYERLLEVNKEYIILFISYLPFVSFIYLFFSNQYFSAFGLELFILILCIIRLCSSFIFVKFAKKKYKLKTDIKDIINLKTK